MDSRFKIAFIGLGNRGKDAYLPEFLKYSDDVEVVAIADTDSEKLGAVAELLSLPQNMCFSSDSLTSLDVSLESHFVALAAEQSRLENGKVIETDSLRNA